MLQGKTFEIAIMQGSALKLLQQIYETLKSIPRHIHENMYMWIRITKYRYDEIPVTMFTRSNED